MPIFLSHISALEVIRRWDSFRLIERGFREEPLPVPSKMPSAPEIEQMCSVSPVLASISKPLHVLVADICGRHHCELVVPHLASSPIPAFAQFELAPGLTCSSPELIALQMTEYASDLELLLLVDELCGYYGIQPHAKKGMVKRSDPLTSIEKISRLLDSVGPCRGAAKLRRALSLARIRSGSPPESKTAHRLEFCARRGGYDLPVVGLNNALLTDRADSIVLESGVRIRKPDIMLLAPEEAESEASMPFRAVAIDYKGAYHRDPWQDKLDTNRRNELLARGVKDYELEASHASDLEYMDWLATEIRKDLGITEPRRTKTSEDAYRARRSRLASELGRIDGLCWTARDVPLIMTGHREQDETTL